jgi:hypothetical protein
MDDRNSWLVDGEMRSIGPGQTPYPADGEWANPDLEQAAGYMRAIFADPAAARERAARGARDVRTTHSPHVAGRSMRRRLEHIHARRGRWPQRAENAPPQAELDNLAGLVSSGGHSPNESLDPVRRLIRRLVLRLMKPFTAYQHTVDAAVIESLRALARDTVGTRETLQEDRLRAAQREAEQLAELRRQSARLEDMSGEFEQHKTDLPDLTGDPGRPNGSAELDPELAPRKTRGT